MIITAYVYITPNLLKCGMIGGKESRKGGPGGYNEEGLSVQETAAVFANFEFLANQEMDMDEIDDLDAKQPHHASGKNFEIKSLGLMHTSALSRDIIFSFSWIAKKL